MRARTLLLFLCVGARLPAQTFADDIPVATNNSITTLATGIDADDTSIVLVGVSTFANKAVFVVDPAGTSETVYCETFTSGTKTMSSCIRGFDGSSAAAHSAGVPILGRVVAAHVNKLREHVTDLEDAVGDDLVNIFQPNGKVRDDSAATSTKPAKTGTSTPATCGAGELFFKTNEPPGENLHLCTSTNTWTKVSASGVTGGGRYAAAFTAQDPLVIPEATHGLGMCPGGDPGIFTDDGTYYISSHSWDTWKCHKTNFEITIDFPAATTGYVILTRGEGLSGVLSFEGRTGAVVAVPGDYVCSDVTGAACTNAANTFASKQTFEAGIVHDPQALPVSPEEGECVSDSGADNAVKCYYNGSWHELGGGGGSTPGGSDTELQYNNAGALGGVSGATVSGGNITMTGKLDLGGGKLEMPNGTTLPATCAIGDQFHKTNATAGFRHYLCISANVWEVQGVSGGAPSQIDDVKEWTAVAGSTVYPGSGIYLGTSGAPTLTLGAGSTAWGALQFPDGSTTCVEFSGKAPVNWDETTKPDLRLTWMQVGAGTGNLILKAYTWSKLESSIFNVPSYVETDCNAMAGAGDLRKITITCPLLDITNVGAGRTLNYKVCRTGSATTDTLNIPVRITQSAVRWTVTSACPAP